MKTKSNAPLSDNNLTTCNTVSLSAPSTAPLTSNAVVTTASSQTLSQGVRGKRRRRCCATYAELVLLAFLSDVQANAHLGAEGYVSLTLFRYLLHKRRAQKEKSAAQFRQGFSEEKMVNSPFTTLVEKRQRSNGTAALPQTPSTATITLKPTRNGHRNPSL